MFKGKLKKTNIIYFLGILQFLVSFFLLFVSYRFSQEVLITERPVILFVGILILLSAIYLCSVHFRFFSESVKPLLFFIFAIGLLIRVVMLFSVPILEDDYNRYFWDGAVTGNGINPYIYSPQQVRSDVFQQNNMVLLKNQAGKFFDNINHPHLKTIYPPVSQLVFAISYKLSPFNLTVWKIVLLFFDLITFFLLLYTLRKLEISPVNVLIYWWNPLLIYETYGSGHFEVIAFPFVLSAILFISRKQVVASMGSLALAVGVKLWPVFLFPLIMKKYFQNFFTVLKPVLLFSTFLAAIFFIFIISLDSSSGFVAYSQSWENNSSLFRIFLYSGEQILNGLNIHPGHAQRYARMFVVLVTIIWVLYQTLKSDGTLVDIYKRSLFIVAVIFLISPTQFPWYFTWMLPFMAVVPRLSLLLLTTCLSLYYLRYYLEPRGLLDVFNNYIVWIEFVPVWILIVLETRRKKLLTNF